jgi:hypothetical protein
MLCAQLADVPKSVFRRGQHPCLTSGPRNRFSASSGRPKPALKRASPRLMLWADTPRSPHLRTRSTWADLVSRRGRCVTTGCHKWLSDADSRRVSAPGEGFGGYTIKINSARKMAGSLTFV